MSGEAKVKEVRDLHSLSDAQEDIDENFMPVLNAYSEEKEKFGIPQDSTLLDRIQQRRLSHI